MKDEVIKSRTAEELKIKTQEIFALKQMAEFSPIMNTMISNLR